MTDKGSSPFEGCFLSISAFAVDLLMAAPAEAHEVALVVCPAFRQGNDVADLLDRKRAEMCSGTRHSGACLMPR